MTGRWPNAKLTLGVLMLAGTLLLSACGPKAPSAAPAPQGESTAQQQSAGPHGEIVEALVNNPVQFNPILTSDLIGIGITNRIFSGLVQISAKMEVQPDIATKWSTSPNGLEWTFELRKDVKWHDGQPLTAEDVAYTYNAIKDKGYTGTKASAFTSLEKATVVDPYTVKFTLKEPFAPFLTSLNMGILPKHLFDKEPVAKMKENPLNRKPVGNGPWKFKEWKEGEYIILEANPDYYVKGQPKIARIRYKFVPDTNVATAQFEAGQIDYYAVPGKDVDRLKKALGDKVKSTTATTLGFNYLGFNHARFALNEKPVRQAIAYAVNRQQIVDNVMGGQAVVVHTDTPPTSAWYNPDVPKYAYDSAKAVKLLEDAGFKKGPDGLMARDGKKLQYTLMYSAGLATRDAMAQLIQANLKEIGIGLELKPTETSVFLEKYVWFGDFDMMLNSFTLGVDPDMHVRYHSSQAQKTDKGRFVGFNRINYINPKVDQLIEAGRKETDPAKRRPIYNDLQSILADDLPVLYLYTTKENEMIKSKFSGMVQGYSGFMFSHQWDVAEGG
jgi:peptide/nickel transport system substrate-binding protein